MAQILGIDTSNYTTSLALLDTETGNIYQKKQLIPVKKGERGIRQSDALFHHTRQLPLLTEALTAEVPTDKITAIGVSEKPRMDNDSYMPCFLAGLGTARTLAAINNIPLYQTTHQVGHVLAGLYSAKRLDLLHTPFLAFHVSGGTTDMLYCTPDPITLIHIERIGTSLDLKAGQAIDRVGVMLGLSFPCGVELEKLAEKCTDIRFLKPTIHGLDCCLSGLENRCQFMHNKGESPENIAACCLTSIAETIGTMTVVAKKKYGNLPVLFAGGVMADKWIRPRLLSYTHGDFATPSFSADNAAGVSLYAAISLEGGKLCQSLASANSTAT